MKYLVALLLIIASFAGGVSYLLFTPGGNDTLKPMLNTYIAAKSAPYDIRISSFRLTPSTLDANITVNATLDARVYGKLSLLQQRFELQYTLFSKSFKTGEFTLKDPIDLHGTLKGTPEQLTLTGKGKAIRSHVAYRLEKSGDVIRNIQADIDRGSLPGFLLLANQKPYLLGKFDLHVNMPELDTQNPRGKAALKLHPGSVDTGLIQRDFNMTLPRNFRYSGDLAAKFEGSIATFGGMLKTTLSNLVLKNGKFYPKRKKLQTDYRLQIPSLSKLQPVIHVPLRGRIEASGSALYDKVVEIEGVTHSFGGKIAYRLRESRLHGKITDVPLKNILHTLLVPEALEAGVFGDIDYDIRSQKGTIITRLQNTRLLPNQLTDILKNYGGIDLSKERYSETTFKADIVATLITFDFEAKSRKSAFVIREGRIGRTTGEIDARFKLRVDDKDFSGVIKGPLQKPKVRVDSSKYLQKRAAKEVKKFIDKKLGKFGLGESNGTRPQDAIKGLLKGLF